jgi:hypothetical protein
MWFDCATVFYIPNGRAILIFGRARATLLTGITAGNYKNSYEI